MADVSSVSALLGILKTARTVVHGLRQVTLSEKHRVHVENALDQLADAQDRVFEIQAESISLREENERLKRQLAEADAWATRLAEYQLVNTEGGALVYKSMTQEPEHFACPSCIEKKRQIQVLQDMRVLSGRFECPGCDTEYGIRPARSVQRRVRQSTYLSRHRY